MQGKELQQGAKLSLRLRKKPAKGCGRREQQQPLRSVRHWEVSVQEKTCRRARLLEEREKENYACIQNRYTQDIKG